MKEKPSIYFFCPAYKDEGNIERVIAVCIEVLEDVSGDYLITIVEDGSPDRTGEIADELAKKYPRVKVIHHVKNLGYGMAMRTGFTNKEREKYDLTVYTDGDGQFDIRELKQILPLTETSDVIIGYRLNRVEGWRREFQSRVYNFLTHLISGIKYRDYNCSFKIFKREVLDHIDIEFPSVFIDAELVIKARLAGYRIAEVPVHHYPRNAGRASGSKWSIIWDTIKNMFRFWRTYKKGELKYRKK